MSIDAEGNKSPHDSRDALARLDRPHTLGTDAEGATHHHSPYDDRVVVVAEDGAIETTFDLSGGSLAGFVAHVDETRGWATLHYAESFGEILKEAL